MREKLITAVILVLGLSGIFFAKYRQMHHPAAVQAENSKPIYYLQGSELRKALTKDPNLAHEADQDGITLLARIFRYRTPSLEDVQILLQAGADPKAIDNRGRNLLHYAAGIHGTPEIISELARAGADPNKHDQDERTPLNDAVLARKNENAEALLSSGATIDLFSAAALGKVNDVDHILSSDPDAVNRRGFDHFTLIEWAALRHQRDVLRAIARRKPKVNIYAAAAIGDERSISDALHNTPGLINQPDESGSTALGWAVLAGDAETTKYLLDHGANPKIGSRLFAAASNGDVEIVKVLLDHGADPSGAANSRDPYKAAIDANHPEIADLIKAARK